MALAQEAAGTQEILSGAVGVARGSIVELIDTLERHELVRQIRDPHDRRRNQVELTDAGTWPSRGLEPNDQDRTVPRTMTSSCESASPGSERVSAACARETGPRGLAWPPQPRRACLPPAELRRHEPEDALDGVRVVLDSELVRDGQ